jgi:hypothetical protein
LSQSTPYWIAKIQLAGLINSLEFIDVFLQEKLLKTGKNG